MDLEQLISSFQSTITKGLSAAMASSSEEPTAALPKPKIPKVKEKDPMNEIGLAIKRR